VTNQKQIQRKLIVEKEKAKKPQVDKEEQID